LTIRETLAAAVGGEDPFVLAGSKITIVFRITTESDILIGAGANRATK
jgi:hypothetical protein